MVAVDNKNGPGIPWPQRALRVRVAVTEETVGPAGAGGVVTGAGPLVEACWPDDVLPRRPWQLDQIVSAAHLTHYPGNGWTPGGDPAVAPDWPEPRPAEELIAEAGADPEPLQQAHSGGDADPEAVARMLADARAGGAIAAMGAGTKALLRPGPGGGWDLRLHSSYPFGDDYTFAPAHAVSGWADGAHPATWPQLWNRVDCPPAGRPDATHDVALAVSTEIGNGRQLAHSGYGWWTVSPVGMFPERIVATQGGLSFGDPKPPASPAVGTRWTGRATGHLFSDERRWALSGDMELWTEASDSDSGGPRLAGRVTNVVAALLDPKTLEPAADVLVRLADIQLETGPATPDGAWSGPTAITATSADTAAGFPAPDAFLGDWHATAHGPDTAEITGRLRLWTPLPAGADPSTDWPRQAVLVAGFGATQTTGEQR